MAHVTYFGGRANGCRGNFRCAIQIKLNFNCFYYGKHFNHRILKLQFQRQIDNLAERVDSTWSGR
jgi:hypothetical protein